MKKNKLTSTLRLTLMLSVLFVLIVIVGCSKDIYSDKIPMGDEFIANVTYTIFSEYDGITKKFEYSRIWATYIDCSARMPIEEFPLPEFVGINIYLNSTIKYYVGFQPLQYVDCGDYVFRGFYNIFESYYIQPQPYIEINLTKSQVEQDSE